MSASPLQVTPGGPQLEPGRSGHRWLDLVVAGSAILISVVSLALAIDQGRIQQRMLAASSWPLLFYQTGNYDEQTGRQVIVLSIHNNGAGPALIKHLVVRYKGREVRSHAELLAACCGIAPTTFQQADRFRVLSQPVGHTILPAGGENAFLRMDLTDQTAAEWKRLDAARFQLSFDACYCSVLGDCWHSDFSASDPVPAKACPKTGGYRE